MPISQIYALGNEEAPSMWENISGQISFLGPEQFGHIDWSMSVI